MTNNDGFTSIINASRLSMGNTMAIMPQMTRQ